MDKLQDALKEAMKTELRETVSSAFNKHYDELSEQMIDAVKSATEWEWDKNKLRVKEQAATQGASYMAICSLIEKVIDAAALDAGPKIDKFLSELRIMIAEAAGQAVRELIIAELNKRQGKS